MIYFLPNPPISNSQVLKIGQKSVFMRWDLPEWWVGRIWPEIIIYCWSGFILLFSDRLLVRSVDVLCPALSWVDRFDGTTHSFGWKSPSSSLKQLDSNTLSLSLSYSLSVSLSLSLSLILSLSLSHTHTRTHTYTLSLSFFLSLSHTHSLFHPLSLSFSAFAFATIFSSL